MNTQDIMIAIQKDSYANRHFIGVFARDQLPKKIKYPSSFIFNTDTSDKPGNHWLAIYYNKQKHVTFFDSFGQKPSYYNMYNYLKKTSKKIIYNNLCLQNLNSYYCGKYCIYFLMLSSRNFKLISIQKLFSKQDTLFNDKLIKNI